MTAKKLAQSKFASKSIINKFKDMGFNVDDDMTFEEAMLCTCITNAVKGDSKALDTILKIMGEEKEEENPIESYINGDIALKDVE